ncbi:hypothetical protein SEVIR_2G195700v4 [Setaria viridis]
MRASWSYRAEECAPAELLVRRSTRSPICWLVELLMRRRWAGGAHPPLINAHPWSNRPQRWRNRAWRWSAGRTAATGGGDDVVALRRRRRRRHESFRRKRLVSPVIERKI